MEFVAKKVSPTVIIHSPETYISPPYFPQSIAIFFLTKNPGVENFAREKGEYNLVFNIKNENVYYFFEYLNKKISSNMMIFFTPDFLEIEDYVYWSFSLKDLNQAGRILKSFGNTIDLLGKIKNLPEKKLITGKFRENFESIMNSVDPIKSENYCCNSKFARYLLSFFGKDFNLSFVKDSLESVRRYYKVLNDYLTSGFEVYSLGDSLEKFNYVWNFFHEEEVISVPFSGSMYINEGSDVIVDDLARNSIFSRLKELFTNNSNFAKMAESIFSGKKVLITDFGHSGKAYITITNILNQIKDDIDYTNCYYLHITPSEEEISNNIKKLLGTQRPRTIFIDDMPERYFINSEVYSSRCIPRYSSDMWLESPQDVWYNGLTPNYKQCNLHRILMVILFCCEAKKYLP